MLETRRVGDRRSTNFMKTLRIGFWRTAGIRKKTGKAVLNSGNCVVAAVASRDVKKSREFIHECQAADAFDLIPDALGSYEELIASPNVDAIYIDRKSTRLNSSHL